MKRTHVLVICLATGAGLVSNALSSGKTPSEMSVALSRPLRFQDRTENPAPGPNVLVVCVDTLRADHVGLNGYARHTTPEIDKFFAESTIYDTAYAVAPSTGPSVISMLTGLYPPRHGVRLLCQRVPPSTITVADHMRRSGYETAAIISNAVLADSACGLGSHFDYYDDFVDDPEPFREDMFERRAKATTDQAIRWLREERRLDGSHFLWVHYIDPHGPYRPLDDKPRDFSHDQPLPIGPERLPAYSGNTEILDGNEYVDLYDEEIAYTDREVGRLLTEYAALGLVDDAVIVFTSDHGESMMDHKYWFQHSLDVYEEMVRVPLMIRYPKQVPSRISTPVSTVDLTPTLLELAGISIPPDLDGRSLLPFPQARDIFCEGRSDHGGLWRGLIRGRRKVMARHGMSNIIRESWAFDLIADPQELNPMAVAESDPVLRILDLLVRSDSDPGGVPKSFDSGTLPSPNVAPVQDHHMLQHLRSLGYVSGS